VTTSPALANSGDNDPDHLAAESAMSGSTGLIRTEGADSGGVGTLRFGILGSYFSGSGVLCRPVCGLPGNPPVPVDQKDKLSQLGTRLFLSATPASFLEAYAGLRYQSTSDNQGNPKDIDIVGNMTLGVKAFTPTSPTRVLSFGGALDTQLLSSAGGVGLDAATVGIRALGTADLTRQKAEERIPLRINLNAGYTFDGSGNIADNVEVDRSRVFDGARQRISRIERFGHDINRVDNFRIGVGVEGVFKWVHPFAEWSIDLPVNRQGYTCHLLARSPGDDCLSHVDFQAVPSRATFGARVYPWAASWLEGLGLTVAFDVGTGATSHFIEEVAPELPWDFHFGLAYAFDVAHRAAAAPVVVEKVVQLPPPVEHHIEGTVVVAGKTDPIPGAIVRYEGRSITGMVADDSGKFRTTSLAPGDYKFAVTADGYNDAECTATIPADAPAASAAPATDATATPAPATTGAAPATPAPTPTPTPTPTDPNAPVVVKVNCELEALPRTATVTGSIRDATTTEFVTGATVSITDPLGRQLSLTTDAEGAFRFANVPAGKSTISVDAPNYLHNATDVALEPRHDLATDISLYPRPKTSNVVITKTELKLKKEVHFLHGSAELLPDSMAIMEEVADVLRSHPEIGTVEVQGHTDDSGTPDLNLKLSTDRANAVRDVLVKNGVDAARLTAHGYGQEKPLVPNTTPKNKAKNRRVQLVIVP
jgi:outer membrane protein OmpA-like peptidoglycan-associated protein